MDDASVVADGDGDEPSGEERPQDTRSWTEILAPEGARGTWRELPGLVAASVQLVWSAGRRELIVTSVLSLVAALAVGAQVFAGQVALQAVLVRAFQIAGHLRSLYDRLYDERIDELRRLARPRTWRGLAGSLLSAAAGGGGSVAG